MATYQECYERVLGQKAVVRGKQAYFYCPFPGCVGYSKRKFNVDLEGGGWYCFHCSQDAPSHTYKERCASPAGGSAIEFAEMMGDDPSLWPTGSQSYSTTTKLTPLTGKKRRELFTEIFRLCELSSEHREAVQARGIDPDIARVVSVRVDLLERLEETFNLDTLLRGGLAYENKQGGLIARHCVSTGRILIPYYDDEQVYYFVGYARCPARRPDQGIEDYQTQREMWPKLAGPAGYTPALYGDIPDGTECVIITEGQFKAECARQKGFVTVGLQGMTNGHASVVKKCVAAHTKRAIILFDTQVDDQDAVDWAAEKLARELLKVGIRVYKASLPLDAEVDKGQKMDIDSYLSRYSTESFLEILCHSRPYQLQETEDDNDDGTQDDFTSGSGDPGNDD